MVDQVNTTAITTYENNVMLALQPNGGELVSENTCMIGAPTGELHQIDDFFGAASTTTVTDRHIPIVPTDGSQDRLWLAKPGFDYYAKQVSNADQLAAGISIKGGYVMQGSAAIRRYWNIQWLNGFFGSRQTGKKGTTVVPFPSGQVVPYNAGFASGGSYHMNVEKFIQARTLLGLADGDYTTEEAYIALTPTQVGDLLREVQVTSNEFGKMGGVATPDGKSLVRFLGFNIVELNLGSSLYATKAVTTETAAPGTVRKNPFWLKSGYWFGEWEKLFVRVTEERSDQHYDAQVYLRSTCAGTRTQDGLSGYIQNYEA